MSLGRTRPALLERARREATHTAAEARPWVEKLARFGFIAKGVVYWIIGFLALKAAMGPGGKTTDATGALRTLLQQPFGKFLLGTVAVGLFGYALWRLVQAALDPGTEQEEGKRKRALSIVRRIGHALSGAAYVGLGFTAVRMLLDGGDRSSNHAATQDWTARFLAQPLGQWLVGLAGAVVIGMGLYCLYRGCSAKFRKQLKLREMSDTEEKWATFSGRVGYAARGVVFTLAGFFLVQAALHTDPREAQGLSGVLNNLAHQPHGPWLLGVVAAGLMAYGVHMFVAARYRKVWG